ncbi:TPA: YSIRK-type signal peptide-containing protein, partial [Enterococcus faecium]
MVSKRNKYMLQYKNSDKKQRFTIRKLSIGTVSVLAGTLFLMGNNSASADTINTGKDNIVKDHSIVQEADNAKTTGQEKSPVESNKSVESTKKLGSEQSVIQEADNAKITGQEKSPVESNKSVESTKKLGSEQSVIQEADNAKITGQEKSPVESNKSVESTKKLGSEQSVIQEADNAKITGQEKSLVESNESVESTKKLGSEQSVIQEADNAKTTGQEKSPVESNKSVESTKKLGSEQSVIQEADNAKTTGQEKSLVESNESVESTKKLGSEQSVIQEADNAKTTGQEKSPVESNESVEDLDSKQNIYENVTPVPEYAVVTQNNNGDVSVKLYNPKKEIYSDKSIVTITGGSFDKVKYSIENGEIVIPNAKLSWPQSVTLTVEEKNKKVSPIYIINLPTKEQNYSKNLITPSIKSIDVENTGRSLILHPIQEGGSEYPIGSAVFSDGVLLGYLNSNHKVRITEYTVPVSNVTQITVQNPIGENDDIYRVSAPKKLDLTEYNFNRKTFNINFNSKNQNVHIIDTNGTVYYNRIWLPTTQINIGDENFSYVNNDGSGVSSFLALFNSQGELQKFSNVQYDGYKYDSGILTQYWNAELGDNSFNFIISEKFDNGQLNYTLGLENLSNNPMKDVTLGFDLDISYNGEDVPVYKNDQSTLYVKGNNNPYGLYISKGTNTKNIGAINWINFGTKKFQQSMDNSVDTIMKSPTGSVVLSADNKPAIVLESSNFSSVPVNKKQLMQFQMYLLPLP